MDVQLLVDAYHARNESSLRIVFSDAADHASIEAFYAAAIACVNESWDTPSALDRHIRGATPKPISADQLRKVVAECVAMTPIGDAAFPMGEPEQATAFRDQWNEQEIAWRAGARYWFFAWGTAA